MAGESGIADFDFRAGRPHHSETSPVSRDATRSGDAPVSRRLPVLLCLLPVLMCVGPVAANETPPRPLDVIGDATARAIIVHQLVALGRAEVDARATAAALTEDDLRVLLENPKMLQPAGSWNMAIVGLIVAIGVIIALIALAASSSSSGFVMIGGAM